MRVSFTKMHGLGNDFVVLDAREASLPDMTGAMARALADRRTGIGCDQVIVLEPSESADFRMRIFNSDGSEVGACGNASRAVAILHGEAARVETAGGAIAVEPRDGCAAVDMGLPRFGWEAIPLAYAMDTGAMPVGWGELENPMAVNVGNPHVVFFVEDANAVDLAALGSGIENDPLFPERINVNVASLAGPDHLALRVWERGAGLTRACGTGACATAVAAIRKRLVTSPVTISLPGGDLVIEWDGGGSGDGAGPIRMTGPASEAFRGSFEWDDFA
ncbi:diaminopimelate epimerase [Erythrobacter litoralis]|jgi:diaminopimelate epimerase|uniref:Diaminopimelate epimerase n=1 Tax=Erythrobacter litoralis TaxID=39960 RepID=A0A074MUF2_9SPHN|nr:diaminopimelate epimerase [Erythrobacter litoralis]AOL23889.1 diaminopimelate epimerase [Erythrobacter litoralis]KEO98626.1 diaminopimelate epimerase [Erythrobacter litoralis]MEE4337369.1 diaminopimelate epimerase [Erythrobacter sp.]